MGQTVQHVYFADNSSTPKGYTEARPDDPPGLTIESLHIRRRFSKHSLLTRRQADIEYGHVVASRVEEFNPDVVISGNMPLDAQQILQKAARREGARFVFWLQDIYSVAARFVLRKKAKLLADVGGAYFERLEKKLLKQSDEIICIAPAFAEILEKWGISGTKVHVIENWAPLGELQPQPRKNAWALEHGVAERFCFMYSGTLGMKHRPELLLKLAKHLERRGDASLVVIAGGAGADWLATRVHEVNPQVLQLLPFQPYERMPEVLSSADVLITLLDAEAGSFAVPSKTLAYLCSGRAVIIAAPAANEAARVVKRADAGIVVSPEDPEAMLNAADRLLMDSSLCSEYGRNGRAYAERTFEITTIANKFSVVLGGQAVNAMGYVEAVSVSGVD
jgi:glycosyltransferase involved in cell wall biosynthesis